jgi:acyl-coenzyme A thioesterase PaaI-like protein
MTHALFEPAGSNTYRPTGHSRGPWDPGLLHGGPVAALLAHVLLATVDDHWFPARMTVDMMRPLAMKPIEITTSVLRAGRRAQLLGAEYAVDGKATARATLQLIARADALVADDLWAKRWTTTTVPAPPDTMARHAADDTVAFHATGVEHRTTQGLLKDAGGPAQDWIRVVADLMPGVPLSPFERVVAAADFGNGVSASLPFDQFSFVNADLTVHVFRLPVDEWVLIDAATASGDEGVGLATSTLLDRAGLLGFGAQSLVIAPR